jgi:hypothetical protein
VDQAKFDDGVVLVKEDDFAAKKNLKKTLALNKKIDDVGKKKTLTNKKAATKGKVDNK